MSRNLKTIGPNGQTTTTNGGGESLYEDSKDASDIQQQHVLAVDEADGPTPPTAVTAGAARRNKPKFIVDKRRSRTLNNVNALVIGGEPMQPRLTMAMLPEQLKGNKA